MSRSPFTKILMTLAASLVAAEELPRPLAGVGIEEKLGAQLDVDLQFMAESGYPVTLRSLLHKGKPVVLNLVYYRCPMLCNLVLNGQTASLRDVAWSIGKEYDVVTVSIDPTESYDLARKKKSYYMETYGRAEAPGGWHFLTDHKENVKKLAQQVGFNYRWDDRTQQYAHAAAIIVLTPEGRVSRYLYGVKFKERDVRLALTEASEGKLGSTIDKFLLFCFHYDPATQSYVPLARNLMKIGGGLIALIIAGVLSILWRGERRALRLQQLVTAE